MLDPTLLFVVNDAGFFLSHRRPLAEGARRAGFRVHIATHPSEASEAIADLGFDFHPVCMSRKGTSLGEQGKTIADLIALYTKIRPDIVHHVTSKPIVYGGMAARLASVPAVVHAISGLGHLFVSPDLRARVLRAAVVRAYRLAMRHPNCAVIVQNDDDRLALGLASSDARVVTIEGSGVDRNAFAPKPLPEGAPIVMLASRMLWDKGVGDFVQAARILRAQGSHVRFVLVGPVDDGNPSAISPATLSAWTREGTVEWWGMQNDMPAVLAQASIVCLPSRREGMPKVLLEACAIGRPIIATDVPGCRHVARDQAFARLVPSSNAPALARAIACIAHDNDQLQRMAHSAVVASSRFDESLVVARTLETYQTLLRRHARFARALS